MRSSKKYRFAERKAIGSAGARNQNPSVSDARV
jgi:hypothetical protein